MSEVSDKTAIADLMAVSGVGFGTSGARGLVDAMTDRVCYLYTLGFLQYLQQGAAIRPGGAVALAGDLRPSSPRIMAAAAAAITDLGYRPVNCGNIPSPALACYAIGEGIPSLMVTGSHIPDDRNGIKFNMPEGEVLKADEAGIREQVVSDAGRPVRRQRRFSRTGLRCRRSTAPPTVAIWPATSMPFLPVVWPAAGCWLYEHSSVAAGALGEIFAGLGAEVVRRGHSEKFVPVDTEAVRSEDMALAKAWAAAEHFDLLVSTDGDGDRPLVGDEHGNWLRGDVAGILTARFLDAETVVTPVSSNTALEKSGWFPSVVRTRIGSPYVIEGMQRALDEGAGSVVGYEANGGFLTMTETEIEGRQMSALPTRDAVIVALAVLLLARRHGVPVSQLGTTVAGAFYRQRPAAGILRPN